MYEEELRNLQNDLNQKDQKISQLEKEQKQLYKKYKSLKGKSKGNFNDRLLRNDMTKPVSKAFWGVGFGLIQILYQKICTRWWIHFLYQLEPGFSKPEVF